MSETALINSSVFGNLYSHCLVMGDELFLKRSPGKNQRLVMMNSNYHVQIQYSVRNSLDKHTIFQSYQEAVSFHTLLFSTVWKTKIVEKSHSLSPRNFDQFIAHDLSCTCISLHSGRSKGERFFGFSYIKLVNADGTVLKDDSYELFLYKVSFQNTSFTFINRY